jgi:hypothetical protein
MNLDMHIEKLDGGIVYIPPTQPSKFPYQLISFAESLAKKDTEPQVYVVVIKRDGGEERHKYYSDSCWALDTFALEMFEQLCKKHDWYYDYSDDHSVWTRGRDSEARVFSRYNMLLQRYPEAVKTIWEMYNPFLKNKVETV